MVFDAESAATQIEAVADRIESGTTTALDFVTLVHVATGIVLELNAPRKVGASSPDSEGLAHAAAKLRSAYESITGHRVPASALGDGMLLKMLLPLVVKALIPLLLASHPELAPLIPALQELIDSILNRK